MKCGGFAFPHTPLDGFVDSLRHSAAMSAFFALIGTKFPTKRNGISIFNMPY